MMNRRILITILLMLSLLTAGQATAASALAEVLKSNAESERFDINKTKALFGESIISDGAIDVTIQRLELFAKTGDRSDRERAFHSLSIGHLYWQYGKPELALQFIDQSIATLETRDALLLKARLLDARGDEDNAVAGYEKALALTDNETEREFIRIRLTMMDVDGRNVDALVDLAGQRDQDFKNRSAVALALLGHADTAVELYRPDSQPDKRFRHYTRQAEWALMSDDLTLAQEAAWNAYQATDSRVDSLYALTLIVEAYRKADSLTDLLQRIDAVAELNKDLLQLRVDLLIETEQYDAAIDYYKALNGGDTDTEARLRLIRLYESAGRTDEMIAEYRRLITAEPAVVPWYSSLAGYYMNLAQPQQALQVWQSLESNNGANIGVLTAAAEEMLAMGFVDEATAMIDRYIAANGEGVNALMFLFETYFRRGRDSDALQAVERLEAWLPAGSGDVRMLADAYERLEKHDQAVRVFEALQASEGGLGYDESMRLAWLYSVVGEKQKALEAWRAIWLSVNSPARRSFAEAQLLLLAAEQNTLADIAVDIEDKLFQQKADKNDINLLVRIYTEVGDSFSAGEVIDEYAEYSGATEVDKLNQLGRVYLQLSEYSKYDEVLRKLEQIDPENRVEHIQNLVLNMLAFDLAEGSDQRSEEIEHWLEELRDYDAEAVSGEFEASILAMGGFNQEAIESYRRALVEKPKHSDNLLLMSDLMKSSGRGDEAVSLLQYVAEHAADDNEFVVAVDGIINMIGQARFGQELPPDLQAKFRWTQRIILERITGRSDKYYLYSLLAEIAQQTNNKEAEFWAVENSLSQAGIRRTAVLRELVTMSTPGGGFGFFGGGNIGDTERQIRYGRRLVGLRQQLPPEVYISLGKTLLEQGDTQAAEKAFDMINDITGLIDVNKTKADLFKTAGHADQALAYYNQALSVNRDDLELLLATAVLREGAGQHQAANNWYLQALSDLLKSQPRVLKSEAPKPADPFAAFRPQVDTSVNSDYRKFYEPLLQGLLLTWPADEASAAAHIETISAMFDAELADISENFEATEALPLAKYSRLDHMARFMRRVAANTSNPQLARHADGELIRLFADDTDYAKAISADYRYSGQPEFASSLAKKAGLETDRNAPVSLQMALDSAREDGDTEAIVKLARLAGDDDQLQKVFRDRIAAGKYREGVAYARAQLSEAEFRRFISSLAPTLKADKAAFLELLVSDPGLVADLESRLDQSLISVTEIAEVLLQADDTQNLQLNFGAMHFIWDYVKKRASVDEMIGFAGSIVENNASAEPFLRADDRSLLIDLLRMPLSASQREAVYELGTAYISQQDLKQPRIKATLFPAILVFDAHPGNEPVLHDLADYFQARDQGDYDIKPLIRDNFNGDHDRVFDGLLELNRTEVLSSWGFRTLVKTFKPSLERALEKLKRGDISDPKTAHALFMQRDLSVARQAPSASRDGVELLQALISKFPDDSRYPRHLAALFQQQGDRGRTEQVLADLYAVDPAEEFIRAAYYFHLLGDQKYALAGQIAADGGPDLRLKTVADDLWERVDAERFSSPSSSKGILKQVRGKNQLVSINYLRLFGEDVEKSIQRLAAQISAGDAAASAKLLRSVWRGMTAAVAGNTRLRATFSGPQTVLQLLPLNSEEQAGLNLSQRRVITMAERVDSVTSLLEYGAKSEDKMLLDAISELPWAAMELDGYLASLPAEQRRNSFPMYHVTTAAYKYSDSVNARLDALSPRLNAGEVDDHELTLWMLLRDQAGSAMSRDEADKLQLRLSQSPAISDLQLLAAGRLFAAAEQIEQAVQYYQLLAVRLLRYREFESGGSVGIFAARSGPALINLSELVEDIADRLPTAASIELTTDIISIAARADDEPGYKAYHDAFILAALGRVMEPAEALRRAAEISPSAIAPVDTPEPYDIFKFIELAGLYARAGQPEAGTTALVAALSKLEEPPNLNDLSRAERQRVNSIQNNLVALARKYGFQRPARLIFPIQASNARFLINARDRVFPYIPDYGVNAVATAESLIQALSRDDIDADATLSLLLTLVYQLNARGEADAVSEITGKVASWISQHSERTGAGSMKNFAAMSSYLKIAPPLDLSREILLGGGLDADEKSALLDAVVQRYGSPQALSLGREVEAGELALMQQLLSSAEEADSAYATKLRQRIAAAEAAKAQIEPETLEFNSAG